MNYNWFIANGGLEIFGCPLLDTVTEMEAFEDADFGILYDLVLPLMKRVDA